MKLSKLRSLKSLTLLAAALATFATLSCGRLGGRFDSQTFRIPWPGADGVLSLQDVEIPTLTDPEHFRGDSAQILVEPGDGGNSLAGVQPEGHYVRASSGVLIPSDYITLQAVTAYAHQERLREVDTLAGAGTVLSWPLSIGLEVKLMSYGQQSTNNAVYDAKLNSLLLVPYDEGSLPITLNPGILAHEHFHFIFQKIVMSQVHDIATQTSCSGGVAVGIATESPVGTAPKPSASNSFDPENVFSGDKNDRVEKTAKSVTPKIYNAYVLRGMNEGFADFWGWLYSHDDSFLAKSLPEQDYMRRLDKDFGRLPSESLVRRLLVDNFHPDSILPDVVRAHNAYSLGTIYARYLRHLSDQLMKSGLSAEESRLTVARALIASLPSIADIVGKTYDTAYLSPNVLLQPLLIHLPALTSDTCESLDDLHAPEPSYVMPKECLAFAPPKPAAVTLPGPNFGSSFPSVPPLLKKREEKK